MMMDFLSLLVQILTALGFTTIISEIVYTWYKRYELRRQKIQRIKYFLGLCDEQTITLIRNFVPYKVFTAETAYLEARLKSNLLMSPAQEWLQYGYDFNRRANIVICDSLFVKIFRKYY